LEALLLKLGKLLKSAIDSHPRSHQEALHQWLLKDINLTTEDLKEMLNILSKRLSRWSFLRECIADWDTEARELPAYTRERTQQRFAEDTLSDVSIDEDEYIIRTPPSERQAQQAPFMGESMEVDDLAMVVDEKDYLEEDLLLELSSADEQIPPIKKAKS
jgi:hypothetical protein